MSSYSSLSIACALLLMLGSRANDFDNDWPTKKTYGRTARQTKWSPPNYANWDKPRQTKSKKAPEWSTKYGKKADYSSKGCGYSNDHSFEDTTEKFLEHNGIERSYIVHLPPSYNHGSDEGHAIVLNLHGYTGNSEERMEGSLMNGHADANDYIAVYPQGTSLGESELQGFDMAVELTHWNDLAFSGSPSPDGPTCTGNTDPNLTKLVPSECRDVFMCNVVNCLVDDVGFIETLLDELEATYCIDRSRIYVTGYSNGGTMTQRLGCELNHRLAAIAPQHGQLALGFSCEPKYDEPMPIINIWGTNDTIVPGEAILSSGGFYFTPVSHVQYKYGKHNKCNVDEQLPEPIATASDGLLEWQLLDTMDVSMEWMQCLVHGMARMILLLQMERILH